MANDSTESSQASRKSVLDSPQWPKDVPQMYHALEDSDLVQSIMEAEQGIKGLIFVPFFTP